jgi:RNA recognition motif-containing protein
MSRKLFVAKLPYDMTEAELRTTFESFGTLKSVRVIMDRDTKTSKGFGFVEFESDIDAARAITALDGAQAGSMKLVVKPAEERGAR